MINSQVKETHQNISLQNNADHENDEVCFEKTESKETPEF